MPYGSDSTLDPLLKDAGWTQRLGRALTRDRHAADDAVQDAWVAVLEGRMAAGSPPRRWLAKVARNFALLGRRKEEAVRRAEREAARSESAVPDPGEIVARAELMQRIVAAVLGLREPYRSTLLQRYLDELSAEEIARRSGTSSSTVRNRLRRGLELVRGKLQGRGELFTAILAWRPSFDVAEVLAVTKGTKLAVGATLAVVLGAWVWTELLGGEARGKSETAPRVAVIDPAIELPATEADVESVAREPERRDVVAVLEPDAEEPPDDAPPPTGKAVFARTILVVDHSDEPVPDVVVGFVGEPGGEELLTDALGRCELRHARGEVEVEAFKREVGIARSTIGFAPLFDGKLIKLRLVVPIEVRGVVLDADGAPVAGARVEIGMPGLIMREDVPFVPDPVTTDEEGRFELHLHSNGLFTVQAWRADERSQSEEVARGGGRQQELVLRLMGALAIEGTVRFSDGSPAGGCVVRIAENVDGDRQPFYDGGPADEAGRFRYALPRPGSYGLTVTSPHAARLTRTITIDTHRPQREIELVFEAPAAVTGRVLWEDGRPASACRVVAWSDGERNPSDLSRDLTEENAIHQGYVLGETAADGSFTLAPLQPGASYSLSFQPDARRKKASASEHDVPAGTQGLEVVLSEERLRGAFVFGRVSSALAKDLRNVRVQLKWREEPSDAYWGADGARWTSETPRRTFQGTGPWRPVELQDDRYRIENLIPGRQYALYWTSEDHGIEFVDPWIATLDGTRSDVVLGAPHALEIQVVDDVGLAAARAEVSIQFLGSVEPLSFHGSRYVGDDGVLLIENVIRGEYHVDAQYLGSRADERVEVLAGVPATRVTLELEHP